jgi:hypothetical protein
MNISVMSVVKLLKKWFVFLKPIWLLLAQNARARIPTRKYRKSDPLALPFQAQVALPVAVVARGEVLAELDNPSPAVLPAFMRDQKNENSEC